MKTGIYQIRNLENDKRYIGSAAYAFQKRWNGHLSKLRNNKHCNPKLQNAWNKYGADTFVFEILLYCNPEDCLFYEQMAIDYCKPKYNICLVAGNTTGVKQSQETRKKISVANTGKKRSEEQRQRYSEARMGRTHSKATKEKIGQASKLRNTGNKNPMFGRCGDAHPASKISERDRIKIQELFLQGITGRKIAQMLDLPYTSVYRYKHRRS